MTEPLRIAIVHYHLNPGGVTRVMENASAALQAEGAETVLLVGAIPADRSYATDRVRVIEELGYGIRPESSSEALVAKLKAEVSAVLHGTPDIWHIHNHSLGKNLVTPRLVYHLAKAGERILLQPHDFPEDGRPANYRLLLNELADGDEGRLGEELYPLAPHVHYAALNSRDATFLRAAGVPDESMHLLPNAVCLEADESGSERQESDHRLFLYPTRAIRRKNLGEFILWSALNEEGDRFATTLAPENPVARVFHDRWVEVAEELTLPVDFAIGQTSELSFSDLLRQAHALVTTSVAEGFGLAFLEPWLVGRVVLGRNLPEITGEFEDAGVDLICMYDKLEIPLDWIGKEDLQRHVQAGLKPFLEAYGHGMTSEDVEVALGGMISGDLVDFGKLDEPLQEKAVRHAAATSGAVAQVRPTTLMPKEDYAAVIRQNRQVIKQEFGLEKYGKRLMGIYRVLLDSGTGPVEGLSASTLLDQFVSPERFALIRT